jgi:ATP-dependent Clp protease ATP-binding subunit ClpC
MAAGVSDGKMSSVLFSGGRGRPFNPSCLNAFTEKARRVVFFARYEASNYGTHYIETEHLLLGLLREDQAFVARFLGETKVDSEIRTEIESRIERSEPFPTSVEVPLSTDSEKVLNLAGEEAERLGHRHIGT